MKDKFFKKKFRDATWVCLTASDDDSIAFERRNAIVDFLHYCVYVPENQDTWDMLDAACKPYGGVNMKSAREEIVGLREDFADELAKRIANKITKKFFKFLEKELKK